MNDISKFLDDVINAIISMGGIIDVPLITDGDFYRLSVEGGSSSAKDFSYKVYIDGVPNAYLENHKTGETMKLTGKSDYQALSSADKAKRQAEIEANHQVKKEKNEYDLAHASYESLKEFRDASDDVSKHSYVVKKHLSAETQERLRVNVKGQLLLPYYSFPKKSDEIKEIPGDKTSDLTIQTICRIDSDGDKRFAFGRAKANTCMRLGNVSAPLVAVTESIANGDAIISAMGNECCA